MSTNCIAFLEEDNIQFHVQAVIIFACTKATNQHCNSDIYS
jgi:hypothetical protein